MKLFTYLEKNVVDIQPGNYNIKIYYNDIKDNSKNLDFSFQINDNATIAKLSQVIRDQISLINKLNATISISSGYSTKTKLYQIFKEEDPEFTIEISKETKNYVIKLI